MATWADVGEKFSVVAPLLGAALSWPGSGPIGVIVASEMGCEATPDAVCAAYSAGVGAVEKIRALEAIMRPRLQQVAIDAVQVQLRGQLSARAATLTPQTDWVRLVITVLLMLGLVVITWAVFAGRSESLLKDATASLTIGSLLGYWTSETKSTLAFWFGTTKSALSQSQTITDFAVTPGSVSMPGHQ